MESADDVKSLRTRLVKEIAQTTALRNDMSVLTKKFNGCTDLVEALETKLKHTEKQRDTYEQLSRKLQMNLQKNDGILKSELEKRDKVIGDIHATAKGFLVKLEESLSNTAKLEEENAILREREKNLVSRQEALEKSLAAETKLRELQGKLVDATSAERVELIGKYDIIVNSFNESQANQKETLARNASLQAELEAMNPRLNALSAEFNKVLEGHKKSQEKTLKELVSKNTSLEKQLVTSLREQTVTYKELGVTRTQLARLQGLCKALQEEVKSARMGGAASAVGTTKSLQGAEGMEPLTESTHVPPIIAMEASGTVTLPVVAEAKLLETKEVETGVVALLGDDVGGELVAEVYSNSTPDGPAEPPTTPSVSPSPECDYDAAYDDI